MNLELFKKAFQKLHLYHAFNSTHVLSTRFPLKKNYTRFSYDGATCQHVICHLHVFANSVIVRGFLDKINNNNNIKTITELS